MFVSSKAQKKANLRNVDRIVKEQANTWAQVEATSVELKVQQDANAAASLLLRDEEDRCFAMEQKIKVSDARQYQQKACKTCTTMQVFHWLQALRAIQVLRNPMGGIWISADQRYELYGPTLLTLWGGWVGGHFPELGLCLGWK